jgi:hypothetical protein
MPLCSDSTVLSRTPHSGADVIGCRRQRARASRRVGKPSYPWTRSSGAWGVRLGFFWCRLERCHPRSALGSKRRRSTSPPGRIGTCGENNWDCCRGCFGRECGRVAAGGSDHCYLSGNQIGRHFRQPIVLTFRPTESITSCGPRRSPFPSGLGGTQRRGARTAPTVSR